MFKFIKTIVQSTRPMTIGRLYVSVFEARLDLENPLAPPHFLCSCFFEKQKISTSLLKGPIPKWNDHFVL
jgi:hypothetical protein